MAGPFDFWMFDLDGTVVDVEPSYVQEVIGRVGDRLDAAFDGADARGLWYENRARRAAVLSAHGVDEAAFWRAYRKVEDPVARAEATYVYDDAEALIPSLDRPVGLVTHCQPRLTDVVLDRAGISNWFEAVVCCGDEVGWKPDPAPVNQAVADLGVESGRGVLVGDARTDVEAARNAGLTGIHIDRQRTTATKTPDRRITALTELGSLAPRPGQHSSG